VDINMEGAGATARGYGGLGYWTSCGPRKRPCTDISGNVAQFIFCHTEVLFLAEERESEKFKCSFTTAF
jgi:hypothetical protein